MALSSPLTPRALRHATVPDPATIAVTPAGGAEKVWVGVRLRPLLKHEVDGKETEVWRASGPGTLMCLAEEKNAHTFQYDRVFPASCSSDEVYVTAAQPMVLSAMKGYNCTLFVYGQTGSGKTTTMRSFMHEATKDIFKHIQTTRNREFVLKMSAIEVYNEVVHDLFAEGETSLKINDDRERGPVVVDLSEHVIQSEEGLLKMLKTVEGRRHVRETKMNSKSSRSHLVVRLYVESRPTPCDSDEEVDDDDSSSDEGSVDSRSRAGASDRSASAVPVVSTMNFVDLAGSERLSQANVATEENADKQKAKMAETFSINISLLTLGKVIRALGGKKGEHVPYRESNLTRILQPSLSGNSRMAIVCTLSPASGSMDNSRSTLTNFANHAKAVTMRPMLNEVRTEEAALHKYEMQIQELQRQLRAQERALERAQQEQEGRPDRNQQLLEMKNAELKAAEEQRRQAEQQRDELQKKLENLKNVILRGGLGGSPTKMPQARRRSFDGAETVSAGGGATSSMGQPRAGGGGAGGGSTMTLSDMRRSWNPTTTSPLDRERPSAGKPTSRMAHLDGHRSVVHPPRLLLECLLVPPSVRDTISRRTGEEARVDGHAAGRAAGVGSDSQSRSLRSEIGKLQMPEGAKAQEALSELQAEVRCFSHQPAAAAAVAGAAAATPETADHWIAKLSEILGNMQQRNDQAAGAGVGDTQPMALDGGVAAPAQADGAEQARQRAHASVDDEAIERVKSEVARLQRMAAATMQTKQVLEALGKAPEREGLRSTEVSDAVVDRLHAALQEAEASGDDDNVDGGEDGPDLASARQEEAGRPRAFPDADAHGDEAGLQRMRSPSVSFHASEGEPASGGRRTASASSRGMMRLDTDRAKRVLSREMEAIHAGYAAEVAKLKAQAHADVEAMREAMLQVQGSYAETQERVERLTMHKQVLVKQVLELELSLSEAGQEAEKGRQELERCRQENEQLKEECERLRQEHHKAAAMASAEREKALQEAIRARELEKLLQAAQQGDDLSSLPSGTLDDSDWNDPPTSSSLLMEICDLWHQLYVPLGYRSRFFLLFRHKELLYLQMEQCRLTNRLQQLRNADYLVRSKQIDKAKKAMDLERKVLAQGLRAFEDAKKEELYIKWGVKHPKGRKGQLVRKLWDPNNTRDMDGMEACSELVVALAGPDATDQFVQLVFGNRAEANARPTHVGALVASLYHRVKTPRLRRQAPPAAPTSSTATNATGQTLPPGGAAAAAVPPLGNGGVTPRRQSSGFLNMMGRVGSILGGSVAGGGAQRPQQSLLGQLAASGILPPSAMSTPRSVPPQVQGTAAAGAGAGAGASVSGHGAGAGSLGAMAADQGPLTRALGPPMSARGTPPLPPPHPGAPLAAGSAPMSARGRPTYSGPLRS
ncbi:hypothetical protein GPECTOR_4g692 [Gonium pectorale]|uniref:Kinesin motor domain-containing protein n=1 Tax=Gonium pectorale TaxID=33097 RepID=A0A150GXL6_GONPE|nr:hypothetical protein GPECTOR_4g692 [Gonium pectorale]|eukprot:KXZ54627.1 hypothetical protein GPECTOR_4g692 [Gonium pectorale]